ncbi:MAG: hypothetical protein V1850_04495 [Candidatus Bathyarchaeota archaeon]
MPPQSIVDVSCVHAASAYTPISTLLMIPVVTTLFWDASRPKAYDVVPKTREHMTPSIPTFLRTWAETIR